MTAESPALSARPESGSSPWATAIILLGLLLLATLCYAHLGTADFITLDDPSYTYNAPHIAGGLTPGNIVRAFTRPDHGFYIPLTWVSLQLDATLFGNDPGGYHIHNLLLFLANIVLVYFILRRCALSPWQAAAPAALWALHPLRVESVAWITERKDVLAGLFGFAAILVYLTSIQTRRWRTMGLVTGLFVLSILAKPNFVTLPVLLLLLDYWPLRRLTARREFLARVVEKLPLLVIGLAASAVTTRTQWGAGIIRDYPLDFRLSNAVVSYARYLWHFIWPADLGVYYPLPAATWPLSLVLPSLLAILAVLALGLVLAKKKPAILVGVLFFLVAALPNIGLVQAFTQASADRFTYVAALGFSLILASLIPATLRAPGRATVMGLTAALALGLSFLSYRQARLWQSPIVLYEHTLAIQESTLLHILTAGAYDNRARALPREARLPDTLAAIAHYRRVLALDPTDKVAAQYLPEELRVAAELEAEARAANPLP